MAVAMAMAMGESSDDAVRFDGDRRSQPKRTQLTPRRID